MGPESRAGDVRDAGHPARSGQGWGWGWGWPVCSVTGPRHLGLVRPRCHHTPVPGHPPLQIQSLFPLPKLAKASSGFYSTGDSRPNGLGTTTPSPAKPAWGRLGREVGLSVVRILALQLPAISPQASHGGHSHAPLRQEATLPRGDCSEPIRCLLQEWWACRSQGRVQPRARALLPPPPQTPSSPPPFTCAPQQQPWD